MRFHLDTAVETIQCWPSLFILQATAVISAAPFPLPSSDLWKVTWHCGAKSCIVSCMMLEKLKEEGGRKRNPSKPAPQSWAARRETTPHTSFTSTLSSHVEIVRPRCCRMERTCRMARRALHRLLWDGVDLVVHVHIVTFSTSHSHQQHPKAGTPKIQGQEVAML
ncbi:hypothetical protein EYF80_012129 [Liparis tanakae]|uniref:Uncharacterized protein n=1 Tax=Liparis tanakae TaxID=230148 RepID=A0A4Z2IHQ1_9TELE|nr:hypothetical protein EYF80_012129 [Liparis tanakae]